MLQNAAAHLQTIGKLLMLPVSVLPVAGIFMGVSSAAFSWLPAVVSDVMVEAGGSVFANMPLIFAVGVAVGFTHNDGLPRASYRVVSCLKCTVCPPPLSSFSTPPGRKTGPLSAV